MGIKDAIQGMSDRQATQSFSALRQKQEEKNLVAWEQTSRIAEELAKSSDPKAQALGAELSKIAQGSMSFAAWDDCVTLPQKEDAVVDEEPLKELQNQESPAASAAVEAPVASEEEAPLDVAVFKEVCQGRDGKMRLFEDAEGHLVAVRSSRLG